MAINFPSAQELEEGGNFTLFPEDEYVARLDSLKIEPNQQDIFNADRTYTKGTFKFTLLSFSDGEPVTDIDGNPVDPEHATVMAFLDLDRMGMIPQPSKSRKLLAALLGLPIADRLGVADPQSLVGTEIYLSIRTKTRKQSGKKVNDVVDYRTRKRRRPRAAGVESEAEAKPAAQAADTGTATDDEPFAEF